MDAPDPWRLSRPASSTTDTATIDIYDDHHPMLLAPTTENPWNRAKSPAFPFNSTNPHHPRRYFTYTEPGPSSSIPLPTASQLFGPAQSSTVTADEEEGGWGNIFPEGLVRRETGKVGYDQNLGGNEHVRRASENQARLAERKNAGLSLGFNSSLGETMDPRMAPDHAKANSTSISYDPVSRSLRSSTSTPIEPFRSVTPHQAALTRRLPHDTNPHITPDRTKRPSVALDSAGGAASLRKTPTSCGRASPLKGFGWFIGLDNVTVEFAKEKAGFLLKHVNYVVSSKFHACSVLRRYNDFLYLYQTLHKRFPFRMLPLLPPKKLQPDAKFLERRRKGLLRYVNFVSRHPILRDDAAVVSFLTETKRDFQSLKLTDPPSCDEQRLKLDKAPPEEWQGVPKELENTLQKFRAAMVRLRDGYKFLSELVERMAERHRANAVDIARYATELRTLVAAHDVYFPPRPDLIPLLNAGLNDIATVLSDFGKVSYEKQTASYEALIEHLKTQKDLLNALCLLFRRADRVQKESDVALEGLGQRIARAEARLETGGTGVGGSGGGGGVPAAAGGEGARLEADIEQDRLAISLILRRTSFIMHCLWKEFQLFCNHESFVAFMYQEFSDRQAGLARMMERYWQRLGRVAYERLPMEEFWDGGRGVFRRVATEGEDEDGEEDNEEEKDDGGLGTAVGGADQVLKPGTTFRRDCEPVKSIFVMASHGDKGPNGYDGSDRDPLMEASVA